MQTATSESAARLYLDLLKRAVTGFLYVDTDDAAHRFDLASGRKLAAAEVTVPNRRALRQAGMDWPGIGYSMCGFARLENLESCIRQVIADDVPGDIIEAGVWGGGASIFARGVLKVLGDTRRKVWLADSFCGLPPPDPQRYPQDAGAAFHEVEHLKVDVDSVRRHFELFDLLDAQVAFIEGYFEQSLARAPVEQLAVARLDGDMYSSTMVALEQLYPKISRGGFVIIDDYVLQPCRAAVNDFRTAHGIAAPLREIDWTGIYWRVE
jgi:O-methyltransferase